MPQKICEYILIIWNNQRLTDLVAITVRVFLLQIPEQDETYLEDSFCVDEEESCKSQSSGEEVCVDFNLVSDDCFANGSKKYKTRRAVMLKQMKMKQNCTRSKKKLSRIILPDDSSEEENNVNDKRESDIVVNPSTAHKNKQQDQNLNLLSSGSSLQPKVLSKQIVNQSPKQRQQTPWNLKDTISEVEFKPQNHNEIKSTSPPCTAVQPQTEYRKLPIQFQVWNKLKKKTITCVPNGLFVVFFFFFLVEGVAFCATVLVFCIK
jgi:Fanconi anemia group M protein